MKKLSILIYSLGSGGAERVISLLLPYFAKEFEVHLVLMCNIVEYSIPKNIKISYLEQSSPYESSIKKLIKIPFLGKKYKNYCQNERIDISLSFMNRPNYINILATKKIKTIKTIISERATPSLQHQFGLSGFVNRWLIKNLYPLADKIISNSLGNRDDLEKNFQISSKKIKTIYNPIDLKFIDRQKKQAVDFDFDKFTFITVGRLDTGKNHSFLIECFCKLKLDAYFLIIGDGPLRENLQKQIQDLKMEKRIFLLGKKENVFPWLSKSNCFLFSSLYEGFPNVLLEALACSLPIISSNCHHGPYEIFMKELYKDIEDIIPTDFGYLIQPNNSIQLKKTIKLVFENSYFSKDVLQKRAHEFSVEEIIPVYLKEIREIDWKK